MSKCNICNKEFTQLQGRNRSRCNSCNTRLRRLRNKLKAINLLGGKCNRCGYNVHPAALEFHHKDSSEKEFNIARYCNKKWEVVEAEVLKCELICSNCHRIEHSSRYDDLSLIKAL